MKITKSRLKQIIKEELSALTEATDDQAAARADFQRNIRQHQGRGSEEWHTPESETRADYKYHMGKQYNDKEALQAIKEVLELVPEFKRRLEYASLSLILRELAEVYAKNPHIIDDPE